MADSDRSRLSVATVDVDEVHEREFLTLSRQLDGLLAEKSYARADTVRDEAVPLRFYAVRRWADIEAAEACHADADVLALVTWLQRIARVTHVVNGVHRLEPGRQMAVDERRTRVEADRRIGFDRRRQHVVRPENERRSGGERRLGPRRVAERAGDLISAARRAREHADAAFSHFKVGAALETADGAVIIGCNIENATYGLTICAERVAMFKAISEGHRAFTRIAIVADAEAPTPPCGACRQILWEFGGDLEVLLANLFEEKGTYRMRTLLPLPFDARLREP